MRKLIVFASALALSGSMAFAMDEDAMDEDMAVAEEEMMMEAAAPSVTLSGTAELGFKNVDDDSMPNAETFGLIRKYQVNFASEGTTDGGLVFGAGISIEDEQGIDEDANEVGGSNVYIGAADGSWKLKIGGNDPGIAVAGGIGAADGTDVFDGGNDTKIGLEGAFGDTSYRFTMADPGADAQGDGDWSAGVKHSLADYSIGLGMDSESGIALGLGASVSGVGLDLFYSQSDESMYDLKTAHTDLKQHSSDPVGTLPYKRKSIGRMIFEKNRQVEDPEEATNNALGVKSGTTDRVFKLPTTTATKTTTGSFIQSVGTGYGTREWKGMGLKASMGAGEGATFSVSYSKRDSESTPAGNYQVSTAGTNGLADLTDSSTSLQGKQPYTAKALNNLQNATAYMDTEVKEIEIGMTYDLGGGASLKASIKKQDTESTGKLVSTGEDNDGNTIPFENPDDTVGNADDVTSVSYMDTNSITTMKLTLAFTF